MKKFFCYFLTIFLYSSISFAQDLEIPSSLKVDTSFAYIQFYSNDAIKKLAQHFENIKNDKLVFLHYGGSHIQAEYPTTVARKKFNEKYENGGRGLIFNYSAANTYSSINYNTKYTGNWKYNKSFQGRKADLPLGICGMTVESKDTNASLSFKFNEKISSINNRIYVFFENDSLTSDLTLFFNNKSVNAQNLKIDFQPYGLNFLWNDTIKTIELKIKNTQQKQRFRFYGISIENNENKGIVYHSTGVGAAAFRSVLYIDKLPEQAAVLKPDVVLLDFGTNDILYENKIDKQLKSQVEKAIKKFKDINPDILIVLTSTQDLFYKGKNITAGIDFRNLMDSIARENNCLFWNWFDISGGLNTIKTWNLEGYAKKDYVHLTKKGYEVKGQMLYTSFINSLNVFNKNNKINELTIKPKNHLVDSLNETEKSEKERIQGKNIDLKESKTVTTYTVKKGDTLSYIAEKFNVSVLQLMKENELKSELIHSNQKLLIPSNK